MSAPRRVRGFSGLQQAFDEVRFGGARTLNLRAALPTADEAAARVERWLRQHQVQQSGEVLVITGRGNNSQDGVSVVRTPGSFVVTLASMTAMLEAAGRRRQQTPPPPPATPPTLAALSDDTRTLLRTLAERSLDALGLRDRTAFVEGEMLKLFGALAATVPEGPERERRLRDAIRIAIAEYD
jgi:hypothetical protein